jgi:hypothetical protein
MRHCSFVVNFEMKTATAHIQALWAITLDSGSELR